MVIADLQSLASGQGAARKILTECCSSSKALHSALTACVARGGNCPSAFAFMDVSVRAGMCIGVLYGREEDEPGANTVPAQVTAEIVRSMQTILEGRTPLSPVNLAEVLDYLSSSDANTDAMVAPSDGGVGILDLFTIMFTQGEDTVATWEPAQFRYNVSVARESCAVVLLNLALSAQTAAAVANHAELRAAIEHALDDAVNLTNRAKKLLDHVVFQTRTAQQGPTHAAIDNVSKHVMISYAWAQQDTVLRIRSALGQLGHAVWIDVEQMSGRLVL